MKLIKKGEIGGVTYAINSKEQVIRFWKETEKGTYKPSILKPTISGTNRTPRYWIDSKSWSYKKLFNNLQDCNEEYSLEQDLKSFEIQSNLKKQSVKMSVDRAKEIIRKYNKWRRGLINDVLDSFEVGQALDVLCRDTISKTKRNAKEST